MSEQTRVRVGNEAFLKALRQIVSEDKTWADLAAATGLKENSVKQRGHRLQKTFMEQFNRKLRLPKNSGRTDSKESLADLAAEYSEAVSE